MVRLELLAWLAGLGWRWLVLRLLVLWEVGLRRGRVVLGPVHLRRWRRRVLVRSGAGIRVLRGHPDKGALWGGGLAMTPARRTARRQESHRRVAASIRLSAWGAWGIKLLRHGRRRRLRGLANSSYRSNGCVRVLLLILPLHSPSKESSQQKGDDTHWHANANTNLGLCRHSNGGRLLVDSVLHGPYEVDNRRGRPSRRDGRRQSWGLDQRAQGADSRRNPPYRCSVRDEVARAAASGGHIVVVWAPFQPLLRISGRSRIPGWTARSRSCGCGCSPGTAFWSVGRASDGRNIVNRVAPIYEGIFGRGT
jgi:hypothetical protein